MRTKGTYLGSVVDPTMAKLAPFWNFDPTIESKYGFNRLVFKLWPANISWNVTFIKYQRWIIEVAL